jgi:hypothetical protein
MANLLHLIRLRKRTLGLEVEDLCDAIAREDVMAPADAFREFKAAEEIAQFGEPDVRIPGPLQHAKQDRSGHTSIMNPPVSRRFTAGDLEVS